MEFVFFIKGKVDHPLTIDPSVWIFDERKVDLHTYFLETKTKEDELEKYTKAISAQWDKEITEGSEPPKKTNGNEIKYKRQELLTGSFGMPFLPFLLNTKPLEDVKEVIIETIHERHHFSFEQAKDFVLGFSRDGKPLKETGPIHVYLGDGSNKENPITHVKSFIVA